MNCENKTSFIATLTERAGFAWGQAPYYGMAGGGWAQDRYTVNANDVSFGQVTGFVGVDHVSTDRFGFAIGAGIEYAFNSNWSGKLQYEFLGLGTENVLFRTTVDRIGIREDIQVVKVGANYRFCWDEAPAPIVVKF